MHTIRLGHPWQVTTGAAGCTQHARKFGRPRTLDAGEQLWLVCDHVPGTVEVRVNGTLLLTLTKPGPIAADITSILQVRNEVSFTVASELPLGNVTLEVRSAC